MPAHPTPADPRLALARWYNEQMLEGNRAYLQGGEGVNAALRSFDRVSDHVRALQPWLAARAAEDDAAAEICNDLPRAGGFMAALRLDRHEQIRWTEAALAGARRLGLREMEGAHLGNLGNAYLYLGDAVRAGEFFREALDVLGTEGRPLLRAAMLGNLGLTYANQGRVAEAIEIFQEHLAVCRAEGDRRSMALPLTNRSWATCSPSRTRTTDWGTRGRCWATWTGRSTAFSARWPSSASWEPRTASPTAC